MSMLLQCISLVLSNIIGIFYELVIRNSPLTFEPSPCKYQYKVHLLIHRITSSPVSSGIPPLTIASVLLPGLGPH